jgi:hypothetical protein
MLNACQALKPSEMSISGPEVAFRRPSTSRGTSRRAAPRRRRGDQLARRGGSAPRRPPPARLAAALAASSVLRSSIAIVIGPTPPGTGVISPARSAAASKSTSPRGLVGAVDADVDHRRARLDPVALDSRGRPTAATSTSARRQTSRGRACASGRRSRWRWRPAAARERAADEVGAPTRPPRRPRAARRGGAAAPSRPTGVHGRRPGRPWASSPPTSASGRRRPCPAGSARSAPAVDLRRRRELEQDAGHARVGGELAQQRLDLLVGGVLGQPVVEAAMPTSADAFCLLPT